MTQDAGTEGPIAFPGEIRICLCGWQAQLQFCQKAGCGFHGLRVSQGTGWFTRPSHGQDLVSVTHRRGSWGSIRLPPGGSTRCPSLQMSKSIREAKQQVGSLAGSSALASRTTYFPYLHAPQGLQQQEQKTLLLGWAQGSSEPVCEECLLQGPRPAGCSLVCYPGRGQELRPR